MDKLQLNYVNLEVADVESLQAVTPLLELAVKESIGEYAMPDVIADIISGTLTVWVVQDGGRPYGLFGVRVLQHPSLKVCEIQFLAGSPEIDWTQRYEEIGEWLNLIETWATEQNCDVINGLGRKGLSRYAAHFGFAEVYRVYSKSLRKGLAVN